MKHATPLRPLALCLAPLALSLLPALARAQDAPPSESPPSETEALREEVRRLMRRVDELERREETRQEQGAAPAAESKSPPAEAPPAEGSDDEPEEWRLTPVTPPPPSAPLPELESDKGQEGEGLLPPIQLPKSMRLEVGGSIRLRSQWADPLDYRVPGTFGRSATDDPGRKSDIHFLRTRLHFDFHVLDGLKAFIELQDARAFGDTALTSDSAEVHIRQAYMKVDLKDRLDVPLSALVGRYPTPTLGDGRLLCDPGFNNFGRQWDGAQVVYAPEGFWFTSFVANLREGQIFAADRDENDDFWFSGLYASARMLEGFEFDAYLYWRHLSDRVFSSEDNPRPGDRKDFTLGGRIKGELGPLNFTVEGAWQWGDQAGDPIRAWGAVTRWWTKLSITDSVSLTLKTEYAYASGDRDPTDGKVQTFDALYGYRFKYYGRQNAMGWQNAHIGMAGLSLSPLEALSINLDGFVYLKDKRRDAWYAADGRAIRRDTTGRADNFVGGEVDFYVIYTLWKRLKLQAHVSHFFAGDFVRDTGRGSDRTALIFLARLTF